jgi:hypothetical protein
VPDYQDAGTRRGTAGIAGDYPAEGNTGPSGAFPGLSAVPEAKYPAQEPDSSDFSPPLLKERLYGFTREEIFDRKSRKRIRELSPGPVLKFQVNQLMGRLERGEADVEALKSGCCFMPSPT